MRERSIQLKPLAAALVAPQAGTFRPHEDRSGGRRRTQRPRTRRAPSSACSHLEVFFVRRKPQRAQPVVEVRLAPVHVQLVLPRQQPVAGRQPEDTQPASLAFHALRTEGATEPFDASDQVFGAH